MGPGAHPGPEALQPGVAYGKLLGTLLQLWALDQGYYRFYGHWTRDTTVAMGTGPGFYQLDSECGHSQCHPKHQNRLSMVLGSSMHLLAAYSHDACVRILYALALVQRRP